MERSCPECGEVSDEFMASDGSDKQPAPGCITICVYCSTILRFDDELQYAEVTTEEWIEMSIVTRRTLQRAARAIDAMRRENPHFLKRRPR